MSFNSNGVTENDAEFHDSPKKAVTPFQIVWCCGHSVHCLPSFLEEEGPDEFFLLPLRHVFLAFPPYFLLRKCVTNRMTWT